MSNLVITNTLVANTTASATDVNQNFTDVKTWLNNRDNASDSWLNVKVTATVSNPVVIKSSSSTTETSIDNTASGDPMLTWKVSGVTGFAMGIDFSDSQLFKLSASASLGTTDILKISTGNVMFNSATTNASQITLVGENFGQQCYIGQVDATASQTAYFGANRKTDGTILKSGQATAAIGMTTANGSASITLAATATNNTSPTTWLTVNGPGSTILGNAALATSATDGFLYIATCAGTPSGAPTAFTGRSPIIYDTSANKIWFYNGSWRGVVVS